MGIKNKFKNKTGNGLTLGQRARNVGIFGAQLTLVGGGAVGGAALARYSSESYVAQKLGFLYELLLIGAGAMLGHTLAKILNRFRAGEISDFALTVDGKTVTADEAEAMIKAHGVSSGRMEILDKKLGYLVEFKDATSPLFMSLKVNPDDIEQVRSLVANMIAEGDLKVAPETPSFVKITDEGFVITTQGGQMITQKWEDIQKAMGAVANATTSTSPSQEAVIVAQKVGNGQFSWNVTLDGLRLCEKNSEEAVAKAIAKRVKLAWKNGEHRIEDLEAVANSAREREMA
jgi:hypothetical protein